MKKTGYIFILAQLFFSCVKDKPQVASPMQVQLSGAKKVYVVNEGIYPSGNAEISLYDPGNDAVIENFYNSQNNAAVGDVAQDMIFYNSQFYIVVNNSNKIIVCNEQFKKTGQINGLQSPRYMLPVTNQKAYVSDLYANAISIIDLNTNIKTGSIACNGWTEEMVLIYNKVFATNIRKQYTYVINTINDQKTDSVFVGINAGSIVIDKQDKIWVLSAGDSANAVPGRLSKIDPVTNQVETTFSFAGHQSPQDLCLNKTKDTLYFLNNGICRMAISDVALPVSEFVARGTKNFYGLGINPNDYTIYAADALDYNQRSTIYIYNPNGSQKKTFKAGLNSNGFYFE